MEKSNREEKKGKQTRKRTKKTKKKIEEATLSQTNRGRKKEKWRV